MSDLDKCPTCGQSVPELPPLTLDCLGDHVRRKRSIDRIGVRGAAKEIGVSPTTVSRIENGYLPDPEKFMAFCKWLGFKVIFERIKDESCQM